MPKNSYIGSKKNTKKRQQYLRKLRAKIILRGLHYNEVAKMIGVSPGHLCHTLNGRASRRIIDFLEKM